MIDESLIYTSNLKVYFDGPRRGLFGHIPFVIRALDGISFEIKRGESFGVVGESGSGKTILLRSLIGIEEPTSGVIRMFGKNMSEIDPKEKRTLRSKVQLIFQNPSTALHPRMTIRQICSEPLAIHGFENHGKWEDKIRNTLEIVGLSPDHIDRYPHQFSGGQRQRIGIARALVLDPEILLCDEPVSALDVSIQAQVLNLFQDLKEKLDLTYLIIAHDLSVVRYLCTRVSVMYLGRFVEIGPADKVYRSPKHPYTKALLASVPTIEKSMAGKKISSLPGDIPNPHNPPSGCPFHPRCPRRTEICEKKDPILEEVDDGHWVACYHPYYK